jgi:hypothetical protein
MINATCHCESIQINLPNDTKTITSCNCSICAKYATLWAYYSPDDVDILVKSDAINSYSWGDKGIDFHHCKYCGCITHYTSTDKAKHKRVAVNFRLVDPHIVKNLAVRYFDGADTFKEIPPK